MDRRVELFKELLLFFAMAVLFGVEIYGVLAS